jgi:hypothetical protein
MKRASISGDVVVGSGMLSTRAAGNGVPGRKSRMRARCTPWQTMWWVPSGAVMYLTILAMVQMRCRSSGPGSSTSAFRCSRIPIGRCSRSACWAAAIDFARAIVTGAITAGNSTMLRTGTMISASEGIATVSAFAPAAAVAGF